MPRCFDASSGLGKAIHAIHHPCLIATFKHGSEKGHMGNVSCAQMNASPRRPARQNWAYFFTTSPEQGVPHGELVQAG